MGTLPYRAEASRRFVPRCGIAVKSASAATTRRHAGAASSVRPPGDSTRKTSGNPAGPGRGVWSGIFDLAAREW